MGSIDQFRYTKIKPQHEALRNNPHKLIPKILELKSIVLGLILIHRIWPILKVVLSSAFVLGGAWQHNISKNTNSIINTTNNNDNTSKKMKQR